MSSIHFLYHRESSSHTDVRETPRSLVDRFAETIGCWLNRINQRTYLTELDDHLLKDIGRTRAQVEAETRKPFWQA